MSAPFTFRGLTGSDGLSDLTVCALYKDSCGYMWMGTSTSVERFDGIHLKHYPIPGENEKLKWVNTIVETSDNRIWMGNDMGLWQVDGDSLRRVAPDVIAHGVRSICQGDDGVACDAIQTAGEIGGVKFAVFDDEYVFTGAFGDETFGIEQHGFVIAVGGGFLVGQYGVDVIAGCLGAYKGDVDVVPAE